MSISSKSIIGVWLRALTIVTGLISITGCSASALLNVASGGAVAPIEEGVAYGENPRHYYDLYYPQSVTPRTPLVAFFYGGSWDSGKRADYAFVGNALARDGYLAAVVDYRLYPEVQFPVFVEDGAKALSQLVRTEGRGRDVFVMGHSAGAQIAALLALDDRYLGKHALSPCQAIAGFIGLAGPYDFLPLGTDRLRAIFPDALLADSQPINFVSDSSPSTLLLHGTGDTTVLPRNSRRLAAALDARGINAEVIEYDGAGHVRLVVALSELFKNSLLVRRDIKRFMSRTESRDSGECA